MENIVENIELLYQKVETYSKSSFELLQLKTLDKATDLLSSLAAQQEISGAHRAQLHPVTIPFVQNLWQLVEQPNVPQ